MFNMKAITDSNIDPNGTGTWAVQGEIFGQATTVFTGDLFACIRFIADNR